MSTEEKDKAFKATNGTDLLDLYDGTDDLLDYGDSYDLDADLIDVDLENYDEFNLGLDDDLSLAPPKKSPTTNGSTADKEVKDSQGAQTGVSDTNGSTSNNDSAVKSESGPLSEPSQPAASSESSLALDTSGTRSDKVEDRSTLQNQQHSPSHRDGNFGGGGYNGQMNNVRPGYPNPSMRGSYGRGGPGGMRGRGQGYTGMGRGNYQGGAGMGQHPMMGMNMGMDMNGMAMSPAMAQHMNMNMGMNMNMNMNMMGMGMGLGMGMGMNRPRFPAGGFDNQGNGFPYGGGGQGMNPGMGGMGGMNMRGPGMATPGRTIHINPNFQKRTGVSPIPGVGLGAAGTAALSPSQASPYSPQQSHQAQQQQQQRPQSQDVGRTPSQAWGEGRAGASSSSASHEALRDDRGDDRPGKNQAYSVRDDRRGSYDRSNDSGSGQASDRRDRSYGDSYRPSPRSDRDAGASSGLSSQSEVRMESSSQAHSPMSDRSRSPHRGGGVGNGTGPASITSRLSLKRSGEGLNDSYKTPKSSGGSTPRAEQERFAAARPTEKDTESVSFLRDKRGPVESSRDTGMVGSSSKHSPANISATGFVKMDNVPSSVSESDIRKLADGIAGVDRILTVTKETSGAVILGFATVEEAKFFRRQINRTTVSDSLVTVTLTSR